MPGELIGVAIGVAFLNVFDLSLAIALLEIAGVWIGYAIVAFMTAKPSMAFNDFSDTAKEVTARNAGGRHIYVRMCSVNFVFLRV